MGTWNFLTTMKKARGLFGCVALSEDIILCVGGD